MLGTGPRLISKLAERVGHGHVDKHLSSAVVSLFLNAAPGGRRERAQRCSMGSCKRENVKKKKGGDLTTGPSSFFFLSLFQRATLLDADFHETMKCKLTVSKKKEKQ